MSEEEVEDQGEESQSRSRDKPMTVKTHILPAVAVLVVLAFGAAPAYAETEGTGWEAFAQAYPTNLHPDGTGTIQIDLMNVGARGSEGAITVTDILPQGLVATKAGGLPPNVASSSEGNPGNIPESPTEEEKTLGGARWDCVGVGTREVTCTSNPEFLVSLPIAHAGDAVEPIERLGVEVAVEGGAVEGSFANRVSVAGGGAVGETVASDDVTLSSSEPGFGFSGFDVWFSGADGVVGTQAGSHPYETTVALGFNSLQDGHTAGGEPRNLEAELPPGFFGEPDSTPRCTRPQLDARACPADTQIGDDFLMLQFGAGGPINYAVLPVFNMEPPQGVVDEFAFLEGGKPSIFEAAPRGYGDYRLVTHINDLPAIGFSENIVTLWGVAPEASHDDAREGPGCEHGCSSDAVARPFLTLPTSCGEPQAFAIHALGTWEDPALSAQASTLTHNALDEPVGFTGCSALSFDPSISTLPDTGQADTPAGLGVNVTFPQEALRVPGSLVEATVKNTTVTLPEGLVINPGQAAGLTACTAAQAKLHEEGAPECSLSSKVGTVKVKTPLLEGELESELSGNVFVLEQSQGGPGEPANLQSHPPTLQLLIVLAGDGVNLKLVANVALNGATGQLTTTLSETPGLPFTAFELAFSGGAQAALATPTQCGTYTTTSDFTPWTTPFGSDLFPSSSFQVTSGPDGGPCPSSPLPFAPELVAGSTTDQAGGFTSFSLLLKRGDGQQRIEKLQFKAPPGLSGMLSTVPLCGEPQAQAGTCSAASQIGHASVASGPGPYPLVLPQPGDPGFPIYLTGPYDGAPFGLSIVTPIVAGPFNLGTIVTRARIEIDPHTAQITVTTEPLPQVVDGVPTDLRLVDSVIDRPGFMFNPTDCNPSSFSGTAYGTPPPGQPGPSATAPIGSHFQVGSCQSLKFAPDFTVSTSGKTSRIDGASLTAKIVYPNTPAGNNQASSQANIASVKVELPRQLPSRLSTLQKACTAAQFDTNPAGCPAASVVGHVLAHTPVLPVPLEGPAYFVSNGGEAFPNLIMVLQGDGVTIDLVGDTFISKAGITSSTFKTVPDQPIQSFELTLPQGPHSALAANGNLCASAKTVTVKKKVTVTVKGHKQTVTRRIKQTAAGSLLMPTEFVGQNGATVKQNTKIQITGCPKTKAAKRQKYGKGNKQKGKT
jgi:hypothetical protein